MCFRVDTGRFILDLSLLWRLIEDPTTRKLGRGLLGELEVSRASNLFAEELENAQILLESFSSSNQPCSRGSGTSFTHKALQWCK